MADHFATPSQDEQNIALSGITTQAKAHGLDLNDPQVQAFIQHQANIIAQMQADNRELYNIIHKNMGIE